MKNKTKRVYQTKKRIAEQKLKRQKQGINRAIGLIVLIMIAVFIIGNQQVRTNNTIDQYQTNPISRIFRTVEAKASGYKSLPVAGDKKDLKPYEVKLMIEKIAKAKDFKYTDYLVRLAKCEGLLNPTTVNTAGNHPPSRDRGLYGINDYWHKEVSDEVAFDIKLSTEWTMHMINSGNQGAWVCDKHIRANPDKYRLK